MSPTWMAMAISTLSRPPILDDTIAWYESNAADKNLDTDAVAGVDYTAASGTLTFDAGDTTATFTVPVLADSAP